jgi:hypothetical protein
VSLLQANKKLDAHILEIQPGDYNPYSADTKANLGIKNLEKEKPEKIA